jgi:O-methyltransferase
MARASRYGSVVWWKTLAVLLGRHFRKSDPAAGFRLLRMASDVFCPDYRFAEDRLDWYHDRSFTAYLERFNELDKLNAPRRWMVRELLRIAAPVPGDTADCGSFEGAGSWLICASNAGTSKVHHIFDSFEGLSEPGAGDGTHWSRGGLAAGEDIVRRNLAQFDAIRLYKGWIPTRFPEVADKAFSFVHVDVDLEAPTADSIAFFYPRMSPGGVLLCDDYGSTTCPGATRVFDDFLADKPERVLSMPVGGGFIVKGMAVKPSTSLPAPRLD